VSVSSYVCLSVCHVGQPWSHHSTKWDNLDVVGKPHIPSFRKVSVNLTHQIWEPMGSGTDKTQFARLRSDTSITLQSTYRKTTGAVSDDTNNSGQPNVKCVKVIVSRLNSNWLSDWNIWHCMARTHRRLFVCLFVCLSVYLLICSGGAGVLTQGNSIFFVGWGHIFSWQ